MARKPVEGTTPMADATTTAEAPKKRRAPQGPRRPSPLYAFATIVGSDGAPVAGAKVTITQQFRDPRKMAQYVAEANSKGEQLLVIAPEA